jgi:hypothetical protein
MRWRPGRENRASPLATEQERNGEPAECPGNWDSVTRPNRRKRNKRVRLWGRLPGRPASPADPSPPSRMHRQRGLGDAWCIVGPSCPVQWRSWPAPLVGCWSSPTWGEHGCRSTRNGRRRGTGRKKFIELVTDQVILSETFFGPSTPDGSCASRNPPAESAGPRLVQVPRRGARSARSIPANGHAVIWLELGVPSLGIPSRRSSPR